MSEDPYGQEMSALEYQRQMQGDWSGADDDPAGDDDQALRGRRNTRAGARLERMVRSWLLSCGMVNVQRIHTGWKLVRFINQRQGKAIIVPGERVLGDFTAVIPGTGQAVLVEVKLTTDRALSWSDFKAHQLDALEDQRRANGLALVAWSPDGLRLFMMRWQDILLLGFAPGTRLQEDNAAILALQDLDDIARVENHGR